MNHRYSKRYFTRAVAMIYHNSLPVAIGIVRNISNQGVYIETRYQPADGAACLDLEFSLGKGDHTWNQRVRGLVIHRQETGLGIMVEAEEFTDVFEALVPLSDAPRDELAVHA